MTASHCSWFQTRKSSWSGGLASCLVIIGGAVILDATNNARSGTLDGTNLPCARTSRLGQGICRPLFAKSGSQRRPMGNGGVATSTGRGKRPQWRCANGSTSAWPGRPMNRWMKRIRPRTPRARAVSVGVQRVPWYGRFARTTLTNMLHAKTRVAWHSNRYT